MERKSEMAKIVQTAGRDALGDFAPEFAHFNDDILFGENWNNEDLDLKTRSLITLVALMSQGITDSSLKYHIMNAKNHGVTQKEMAAAITHVAFYAGWPKAWAVFNLAKDVYEDKGPEIDWTLGIEQVLLQLKYLFAAVLSGSVYWVERNSTVGEKNLDIFEKGDTRRVGSIWPKTTYQSMDLIFTTDMVKKIEKRVELPEDHDVKKGRYPGERLYKKVSLEKVLEIITVIAGK